MSGLMPNFGRVQARYGAESERPNLWTGLQALWTPPVTPTGLTWRDQSMHHNHGTLTNMDPATDWVPSPHGWALDFDGSDDHVMIPIKPLLAPLTIVIIAAIRSTASYLCPIGVGPTQALHLYPTISGTIRLSSRYKAWAYDNTGVPRLALGEFGTYTFVVDADNLYLYLNGKQIWTSARTATPAAATLIKIGCRMGTTPFYFDGIISSVWTYNRALLPAEIADLYAMLRRRQVVIPSGGIARPLVDGSLASGNVGLVA